MERTVWFLLVLVGCAGAVSAQDIQINRQNKTIAVTADDSVTADAEVAVIAIGYHNYAPSQKAAFREMCALPEPLQGQCWTQRFLRQALRPRN